MGMLMKHLKLLIKYLKVNFRICWVAAGRLLIFGFYPPVCLSPFNHQILAFPPQHYAHPFFADPVQLSKPALCIEK